ALQPDLVLFDRFFTEEQFGWRIAQACPTAVRLLDTEDLHCLRYIREQRVKEAQQAASDATEKYSLNLSVYADNDLRNRLLDAEIAQREIAAIYRCDLSLIISSVEMRLLQTHFSVP